MARKKNKNYNENEIKEGNSAPQRIGTAIISFMTLIGLILIVYTGTRLMIYRAPVEELPQEDILVVEDLLDEEEGYDEEKDEEIQEDKDDEKELDDALENDEEGNGEQSEAEEAQVTDPIVESPSPSLPISFPGFTNVSGIFVRAEPHLDSIIYIQLPIHTEVQVLNSQFTEGWMEITVDGITGYVLADFISPVE